MFKNSVSNTVLLAFVAGLIHKFCEFLGLISTPGCDGMRLESKAIVNCGLRDDMMSLVCVPSNWDCMCLLEYGLVLELSCRLWD